MSSSPPIPRSGVVTDEHQISGRVGVPITDYWTVNGALAYDLAAMNWASVTAGATYDDGYLVYGASAERDADELGPRCTVQTQGTRTSTTAF